MEANYCGKGRVYYFVDQGYQATPTSKFNVKSMAAAVKVAMEMGLLS